MLAQTIAQHLSIMVLNFVLLKTRADSTEATQGGSIGEFACGDQWLLPLGWLRAHILLHTHLARPYIIFVVAPLASRALLRSHIHTLIEAHLANLGHRLPHKLMEASPSRSDSFSRAWLGRKAPVASLERLDADAGLRCSFDSSTSFIDMDPAELFSMRWTSSATPATEQYGDVDVEEEAAEFDFGQLARARARCSSPLLVGAGLLPLTPCEPRNSIASYADAAFYSAQSTPASASSSSRRGVGGARAPLLATRRILLRYLRLLAPLCRKVRALPVRALAPRSAPRAAGSFAATTASPARQSTSSYASAAECWCQGHAETAVRDAILYCKKSVQGQDV
uniref:Uncharacterized protein n=1 Tax=Avena sativa TaxID=4498 RepID=A0ACD5U4J3_AVESA